MKRFLLLFSLMLLVSTLAISQISITCSSLNYTQNFNSYNPNSASNFTTTIPAGWSGSSSGTATYNGIGTGTSGTGGYWGYGSGGEISLGALRSGTPGNITYRVQFTNNTGATITALAISYDFEQWRFANTSGFSVTGTNIGASVSGLGQNGNSSGTNGTVQVTAKSVNLTSLSINDGTTFTITWVTSDVTGSDNGIAVDNFSLTATIAPSTQVTAITITNASPTSQSLLLTRGNGSNVIVVAREGAAPTAGAIQNVAVI